MTDYEIDIREIKERLKQMQEHLKQLDSYLVPPAQATNYWEERHQKNS